MKRFIGMWIRYDDGSLEYHEDSAHAFSKRPVVHKVVGFFSEIRKYVGSYFFGKPYGPEGSPPYPEGSLFDALLRRHKDRHTEPDGIFREGPSSLQPGKTR